MQPEILFSLFSMVAMLGWLILILLPRRWAWLNQMPALWIPLGLSLGYSLLIGLYFFQAEGGFDTLANVQRLFTHPMAVLAGWVHYLAFDLLLGCWIARKADALGISRLIQAPILLATFMFGPLGFLLFMLLKGMNNAGLKKTKSTQFNLWWQASFFMVGLFVITLLLWMLDTSQLDGVSVWTKPLKFESSLVIYFITLALLARRLPENIQASITWRCATVLAVGAGVLEVLYIVLQGARGRASHYNFETPIESIMYGLMGVGAVILVAVSFYLGWLLYRDYRQNKQDNITLAAAYGLMLGSVLTLVIASTMASGQNHFVGTPVDNAWHVPILGWALTGGDLRGPHFFATHLMQFLPLYGWWLQHQTADGVLDATLARDKILRFTVAYCAIVLMWFGASFFL